MSKEFLTIEENEIDDYTKTSGSWKIKKETFKFIDSYRVDGDGEWYEVIVQRKSDKKHFKFSWGYGDTKNYYENVWAETTPHIISKTIWK